MSITREAGINSTNKPAIPKKELPCLVVPAALIRRYNWFQVFQFFLGK